jgi:molybdopterin-binding protein
LNVFEIKNLDKEYKKDETTIQVLSNINFSIKKGECFVIIGPNGSGKTTLLRLLALLDNPTKGSIFYVGKDLSKKSKKEKVKYRRELSFVRQKPVVRDTTVFNNVCYGLKVRKLKAVDYKDSVNEIIETVGLQGMESKNARALSGGEMQRVAIAMNFVIDPEIYLLDEVSANLDPVNLKLLERFIMEIKENKKKTIVMSTHDPIEAIRYADRIAVLSQGKISQIGSPKEIFSSPMDEFTALFMGYENVFKGIASYDESTGLSQIKINDLILTAATKKTGEVKVCIRPESIGIITAPKVSSYRNTFKGIIEQVRDLGNISHMVVNCESEDFLVSITDFSRKKLGLDIGSEVYINFKATDVKIL